MLPLLETPVDIRMARAEYEISCHNDIGCPIYNCTLRSSDTQQMMIHRGVHRLTRQFGLAEGKHWTLVAPQAKVTQGRAGDQAIVPPLQDGTESDSALLTDSLGAENLVNVTQPLPEHLSDE